jgi:serine/threonine protein phosphatase 1
MVRLFSRKPVKPSTAAGERIYAIGDIHGRYDLFRQLLDKVIHHWEAAPQTFESVKIILLGDVIDRGPESAECLEFAHELVSQCDVKLLLGNHEDLLIKTIEDNSVAQEIWLANGGLALLESYQIEPRRPEEDSFDFAKRLGVAMPSHLVEMLRAAPLSLTSGDYFFVHAGVRPGITLSRQKEQDLLFIRETFTQSARWHGAVIVHGHSIVDRVEFHNNRIAVDTGAYKTDRLSCVCLEGRRRQVLHT